MDNTQALVNIIGGLIGLLVTVGLFLLLLLIGRELTTWYFKINKIIELLTKIEINTKEK